MALGSCHTCIKYLMFAFNFLFWLLGCAILAVGIWILVGDSFSKYVDGAEEFAFLHTGAYILIVVGVIIMVIGFLGCCGAIRESQVMLGLFFGFLFIIFAVLLGAGIWAVMAKDSLKQLVADVLQKKVNEACDNNQDSKNFMKMVQDEFECCGATSGVSDYITTSCVINPNIFPCAADATMTGCNEKLQEFFSENLLIVAGVAIGIAFILILGMIFSMVLCCAIRDVTA
ncbi:CD9 antigen-like [Argopecten irradians]|uniref:CD9 antigen-like n=1 Tax=Argopecten irradians TaxID=31199 RepID=UPI00371EA5B1